MESEVDWNLSIFSVQIVVISNMNCSWKSVISAVSQVPVLCPELFNILVKDLDDRMPKYTISNSAGNDWYTKWAGCHSKQSEQTGEMGQLFKFKTRKYPVLTLKKNNPMHQYRLRTNWIGSNFSEKALPSRWTARCSWGTNMSLQKRVPAAFWATL